MGPDESNKNKMNADTTYSTPASGNPPQPNNPRGNFHAQYDEQNSYPYGQAPAANEGTILYDTTYSVGYTSYGNPPQSHNPLGNVPAQYDVQGSYSRGQPPIIIGGTISYGTTYSVGYTSYGNPPQSHNPLGNFPTQYDEQGSYPYGQALTINGGTILYGTTYPVGYTSYGNPPRPHNPRGNFHAQYDEQNSYPYGQAPAANEGTILYGTQDTARYAYSGGTQWPSYDTTYSVGYTSYGNPPRPHNPRGNFHASRGKQGSNPHKKAPTTNEGTISDDTAYPAEYIEPSYNYHNNPPQSYDQWGDFPAQYGVQALGSSSQAPTINEGGSRGGNQQSQVIYTAKPIKFMKKDSFLKKELLEFLRDNDVFEPLLVLFPYYEETKNLIESFNPREKFTCKNSNGSFRTSRLPLGKQILWDNAKNKYSQQVGILEDYSKDWKNIENKKLPPEEEKKQKKGKTKNILKNFISTYDTSDAVQMSLCFDIYNEGFKECVNDILDNKDIEPKEEDYGKERTEEYKKEKDKYDAFKEAYKEKLEEQKKIATFTESELNVTLNRKDQLNFPWKVEDIIKRIVEQGKCDNTSNALKAQELFYFANRIFRKQGIYFHNREINFGKFFNMYIAKIKEIRESQYIQELDKFKDNPTNYGKKAKAEIIYTVLNGLANALPYKDIIEQIWNGHFLLTYYKDEKKQIIKNRLRLNLIETTLTEDLVIYKTQKLQSELHDYLIPQNPGITQDELDESDMRKKLLTEVNTRKELKNFKKNILASKFQKLKNEDEINTSALEGILSLAANNGINIPLEKNYGLDSLILNYIKGVNPKNENNVQTLSNIIYTVLYPSVTYMSSKQDNGIIKELKTKLSGIKEEICKQGIDCESYLSYSVITIDKFIDCYESKKSKKQSSKNLSSGNIPQPQESPQDTQKDEESSELSESAKPAEQEKDSNSKFSEKLINIIKKAIDDGNHAVDNNVKAIITLIKYYASERQLEDLKNDCESQSIENSEKSNFQQNRTWRNQSTKNPERNSQTQESENNLRTYLINELKDVSQDKPNQDKESESKTESKFEELIKKTIISSIPKRSKGSVKIKTQHKIADREVDFYITFNENCSIKIADNFIIPIKAGTEIVIEADGAPHFEKDILPENLEEAQHAIIGKTIARNHEIKGGLIDKKASCGSLRKKVSTLRDKEGRLLECACYLQRFRQRRKHLDPTIDSNSSKKFYKTKEPQYTKKDEQNSRLLEMTPELRDLQNTLQQHKDVKEVIRDSIKESKLFFSIPLLTSCMTEDKTYKEEEIQKVFLNCFINAYCSQALSNLKEFYRWKAEEEKKELENRRKAEEEKKEAENTETTQPSRQKQNGDQTTRQGENGTLTSNKETVGIRALEQINVTLTSNKETVGIRALTQIREARDEERTAIKEYFSRPENMRTSGQGNVL